MNLESRLSKEFVLVQDRYPDLGKPKKEKNGFSITGNIQLIDPNNGSIWDTYQIKIELSYEYPSKVPSTYEVSKKVDRKSDNHVGENGKCCLAPRLEELLILGNDYTLIDYLDKLVIPFFASQKLIELGQGKGIGEYSHFGSGIIEYYKEKFKTSDINVILKSLYVLSSLQKYNRNEPCFCGSGKKYKHCHWKSLYDYFKINRMIFLDDIRDMEKTSVGQAI